MAIGQNRFLVNVPSPPMEAIVESKFLSLIYQIANQIIVYLGG